MSYVHVAGTVGTTPTLRTTRDGKPWTRLRLAVTRWDHSSQQETTDWWTVKLYGRQAERAVKILKPGVGAVFRGTPQHDTYRDKEGVERSELSVSSDSFTVVRFPKGVRGDGMQPMPLPSLPPLVPSAPGAHPA